MITVRVQLNWIRMMTDGNERNTTRDYVAAANRREAMSKLVSAHPTLRAIYESGSQKDGKAGWVNAIRDQHDPAYAEPLATSLGCQIRCLSGTHRYIRVREGTVDWDFGKNRVRLNLEPCSPFRADTV